MVCGTRFRFADVSAERLRVDWRRYGRRGALFTGIRPGLERDDSAGFVLSRGVIAASVAPTARWTGKRGAPAHDCADAGNQGTIAPREGDSGDQRTGTAPDRPRSS